MKKILKKVGLILAVCVLSLGGILAGLFFMIFGNNQKPQGGPPLGHGIESVADGITTSFLIDAGFGKFILIDAGNNPQGAPILQALSRHGKTGADVAGIFITHAHTDHDAAVNVFPNAIVYAMKDEVNLAAGKEAYESPISKILGAFNPHPFTVTHALQDGETVQAGNLRVTAYEVSGHTPGSAAYLTQGVLFTGDAFAITKDQTIQGPVPIFSRSVPQAIRSLKNLLLRLTQQSSDIEFIATSHSGTLAGPLALKRLKEFLLTQ